MDTTLYGEYASAARPLVAAGQGMGRAAIFEKVSTGAFPRPGTPRGLKEKIVIVTFVTVIVVVILALLAYRLLIPLSERLFDSVLRMGHLRNWGPIGWEWWGEMRPAGCWNAKGECWKPLFLGMWIRDKAKDLPPGQSPKREDQ
jgi:hypothetical protein